MKPRSRDSFLNTRKKLEGDRVGKQKREKPIGMHWGLGSPLSADPTRPEKQPSFYVGGARPTTPMLGVRKMLSITVNLPIVSSSGADHHRAWPDFRPANFEGAILKKRLIPEQMKKVFFRCGKEDWHDLRPNNWKILKHWHNIMILWSVKALRRRGLASPL